MSESDFYTVNHRYEAQGAPLEWPTWELQAHGSAAPAPDPAAPDDPAGSAGPGCPLPRLDPLGPWCSARLTFADGARVDVLVTVSDDHITVEDVRADPPLTLDGLADLARWIEGPLDDAFRAATGQPRKTRPTPRQAGPADAAPEQDGGPQAGPPPEPGRGAAADPLRGSRPASPHGPTRHPRPTGGPAPAGEPDSAPTAAGAEAEAAGAAERATCTTGEAAGAGATGAGARETGPTGATGLGQGEGVLHRTAPETGFGHPADPRTAASGSPAEPSCEQAGEQPCEQSSGRPAPAEASVPAASPTPPDAAEPSPSSPSAPPVERARSAVLARTRTGERRKIAADAYRQAQREGRDPVLAVMHATGRNRRRSLRLIAGARDEGLLTPRHNKR
ncbi:hypothetical protein TPA0598_07_01310 [Streptomyces lydicamycinicus]|uniref:Uncharacterized protein n=1 Tax=Streptomyces lydicamycinicus TaxID=1546107 RepID=A0A0P4RCK0_9ACTN|nr:hypothetical protein TPA0598_07_01310 [Streptomyces lydicamycinicus]